MSFETTFEPLEIGQLGERVADFRAREYRFVQILAVNTDDGIDLIYSFMKEGKLENLTIKGIKKGTKVPSITDTYLAAFVFENEAHDLFGVEIEGIAIDFGGNFYRVSEKEPMTIITPEKKAEMEKAAKIAAAKAAKAAKTKGESDSKKESAVADKLKDMDPEKAAKVKAAMEAKKKREAEKATEKDGE